MRRFSLITVLAVMVVPLSVHAQPSCTLPLTYSIGTIDSRFGMSREELQQDLQKAEAIWEVPLGRSIFQYATTSGRVQISLSYDARQADTDKKKATLAKLQAIKALFEVLHGKFDIEASSTEAAKTKNLADFAAYNADVAAFNIEVDSVNTAGGASRAQYESIIARRDAFNQQKAKIESDQTALNDRISRLNALSQLLNQAATAVNMYIAGYNASLAANREYEEGVFEYSGGSQYITIFEFPNSERLVRALAHEMGHALGFEHLADENAIMYRLNTGAGLSATAADLSQARILCGISQ